MADVLTRERRCELLAAADHDEIVPLAERLIDTGESPAPTVIRPPQVGMAVLQVREPVEQSRFYLGEVLVTECSVEVAGVAGWSMRAGDDRIATLAAALLDAVAAAGLPARDEIDRLCNRIAVRRAQQDAAEWAEIEATTLSFEELI